MAATRTMAIGLNAAREIIVSATIAAAFKLATVYNLYTGNLYEHPSIGSGSGRLWGLWRPPGARGANQFTCPSSQTTPNRFWKPLPKCSMNPIGFWRWQKPYVRRCGGRALNVARRSCGCILVLVPVGSENDRGAPGARLHFAHGHTLASTPRSEAFGPSKRIVEDTEFLKVLAEMEEAGL